MFQTLSDTLVEVQEPTVAEQKIHWWHEELDRLFEHKPRHPACKLLTDTAYFAGNSSQSVQKTRLLEIFAANNNEKFLNAPDAASLRKRLLSDYGNRVAILAELLDGRSVPVSYLENLSMGLGLFDRLRQSHRLHHRGYPIWADSSFEEFGLQPDQLMQPSCIKQTSALFAAAIKDAINHLDGALTVAAAERDNCRPVLPLTVNARLRQKQLTLWANKSLNPMEKYVTLTPFNKAWTSWRCRANLR